MKYVKALDGVRALAILLVMLFHFYFLLEVGWIGVQLFFVLSGFLITSILLDGKQEALGTYLKRFYWRRSLRIFPLYYVYLLGIVLLFLVAQQPPDFLRKLPYLLLYNYNHYPLFNSLSIDTTFTHFWSLSVEEQFYLFWPLLIFFLPERPLKILLIVIIVSSPLIRWVAFEWLSTHDYPADDLGQIVYRLTLSHFDGFAFGALIPLYKLQQRAQLGKKLLLGSSILFFLLGAINIATTAAPISSWGFPNGGTDNYQYVWSYTVINLLSLSLIITVLSSHESMWLRKFFETPLLVHIGKVSYGMYVYHWILLAGYRKILHPFIGYRPLSFVIYLMLTFAVSWLSFFFFERYFINLKDKFPIKKTDYHD
jgi:peptidoglycan/LPS O-acetylase OafA/YrhL